MDVIGVGGINFENQIARFSSRGMTTWVSIWLIEEINLILTRRERSGLVVECLTQDRRAAGSSLTGVTALWSLSKTHLF